MDVSSPLHVFAVGAIGIGATELVLYSGKIRGYTKAIGFGSVVALGFGLLKEAGGYLFDVRLSGTLIIFGDPEWRDVAYDFLGIVASAAAEYTFGGKAVRIVLYKTSELISQLYGK